MSDVSTSEPKIPWDIASRAFPWLPQSREEISTYVEKTRGGRSTEFISLRGVSDIHIRVEIEMDLKDIRLADLFPLIPNSWQLENTKWYNLDRFQSANITCFQDLTEHCLKSLRSIRGIGEVSIADLTATLIDESVRLSERGHSRENPAPQNESSKYRLTKANPPAIAAIGAPSDTDLIELVKAYIACGQGNVSIFQNSSLEEDELPAEVLHLRNKVLERSAFEWLTKIHGL